MKTKKVIVSMSKELEFGFWDYSKEEFVSIEPTNPEHQKILGASEILLDALAMCFSNASEWIHEDLKDIWERLDTIVK